MKYETVPLILFIFSLVFLMPITKPVNTVTAIPDTTVTETFRFQSPSILLTFSSETLVILNVSFLDFTANESSNVYRNFQFVEQTILDLPKPGFYNITVFVTTLGTLDIREFGVYPLGWALLIASLILNAVIIYRRIRQYIL